MIERKEGGLCVPDVRAEGVFPLLLYGFLLAFVASAAVVGFTSRGGAAAAGAALPPAGAASASPLLAFASIFFGSPIERVGRDESEFSTRKTN